MADDLPDPQGFSTSRPIVDDDNADATDPNGVAEAIDDIEAEEGTDAAVDAENDLA